MDEYNVMVTQANSVLGLEFLRQFLSLPCPPEYVFATYTGVDALEDLVMIQESSTKTKVMIMEMDINILKDIEKARTSIQEIAENRGVNFLINIICYDNIEKISSSVSALENRFKTYTVTQLTFFQALFPLLEAPSLRHGENSKSVFFNITEDNSAGTDLSFEVNKVALNLAMDEMLDKIPNNNVLLLNTCLNMEEGNDPQIEDTVISMLFHIFSNAQMLKNK